MRCIFNEQNILGEGPLWDPRDQRFYWVDIEASRIHAIDPLTGRHKSWEAPARPTCIVMNEAGGFLVALENELATFSPDTVGFKPIPHTQAPEGVRYNDGKCDPQGRFWVGTSDLKEAGPLGALYCFDGKQGTLKEMDKGFIVANGLGWSPDHSIFYYTDSPKRTIYQYSFHAETGDIHHRTLFACIPESAGYPDGLCVDCEGYVWSAHWMGGRITRYDPDGRVDEVIELPVVCPTSCCFGGENFDQLFITTATRDLNPSQKLKNPQNGGILMTDVGAVGLPATAFFMHND